MIQGTFGTLAPEQKKWLSRIQDNGRTLIELVNDFRASRQSKSFASKRHRAGSGHL
jgi:hypothetical protein